MDKYKFILTISILLGVIILLGIFYWFDWRPSQIRKECVNLVNSQKGFDWKEFAATGKSYSDETKYKNCLRKNGINE